MTTEFLSRCLYTPPHPTIHIVRMQLCGPVLHIQGPTSRLNGIYKDYSILQLQLLLIKEEKTNLEVRNIMEIKTTVICVLRTVYPGTTLSK